RTGGAVVKPQWIPTETDIARANITRFTSFVEQRHGSDLPDYRALWQWSVDHPGEFWQAVWDTFDVVSHTDPGPPLADASMPGAVWFPGATLNFVEHVFRGRDPQGVAVVHVDETGARREITWAQLERDTAAIAATLEAHGIGKGDRVVGYLPNI